MKNKIFIVLAIAIVMIILLNYKNSMEPFAGVFEQNFLEKKTLLDEKITTLNNNQFNFNVTNPVYSHACSLQNDIAEGSNNVLNNTIEDAKLNKLITQVGELEKILLKKNIKKDLKQKINTIKSHNNGADFGVIPLNDYSLKYLISANNGCIGASGNNYDIYRCNKNDPSQQFELKRIYNQYAYGRNSVNQDYIEDKNNIAYPFVMAKSVVNNNCLTNNNNNVRLMPCNMLKSQRFEPLTKSTCY